MDPDKFADRQMELVAEFGKYVFDHPEMDNQIPNGAYVYFEVAGEDEFNRYARKLAKKNQRENGMPVVMVQIKGLASRKGASLIKPVLRRLPALEKTKSKKAGRRKVV